MSFEESSQYLNWTFTKDILHRKRKITNDRCRLNITQYPRCLDNISKAISSEDEEKVVNLFTSTIQMFFRKFVPSLPNEVFGTAATYFRRFFTKHSVMDFHPREIMIVCLYISCKVNEISISLDKFLKNIPKNSEKYRTFIHQSELFILKELNFDLMVITPFNSFKLLLIDFIEFEMKKSDDSDQIELKVNSRLQFFEECLRNGLENLISWYETDIMLIYSPPDIALAAIDSVLNQHNTLFLEYLNSNLVNKYDKTSQYLINQIKLIRDFISEEYSHRNLEELADFEARIDCIRNPIYNIQSEEYQKAREEYDVRYSSF